MRTVPASDKRRAARQRTLKGGKIAFNYLGGSIDCVVRNLSDTGACLVVTSQVGVPDIFDLFLEAGGDTKRCRVAWRSGEKLGVEFL